MYRVLLYIYTPSFKMFISSHEKVVNTTVWLKFYNRESKKKNVLKIQFKQHYIL